MELYDELRKVAAQRMAHERVGDTLQATALVNEAWLRLNGRQSHTWRNEKHLIAAASEAMRRILVDRARRKQSQRNGGRFRRTELDPASLDGRVERADTSILIDELLEHFDQRHPDKTSIVELRFFVGLTFREIAGLLDLSERTVKRHWLFAKAWLQAEAIKRR